MKVARTLLALLAALALLGMLAAGPGTRFGAWDFRAGFALMQWAAYLGLAAAALALIALLVPKLRAGAAGVLALALLMGLIAGLVPLQFKRRAQAVPPIHDISTDLTDPPEFVAVLPLRADAPNPATYGGPEVAAAQREAYPDIQPLVLEVAPDVAFARALDAARAMGWDIVANDAAGGRIEATATTAWFGFKDDIVVRVVPAAAASKVDVRSVSRVGKSDIGANAKRIRAYLTKISA